jgi:dTDP-4-dehydrorhamnose 3,5-epimerase
MRFEPTAVAGAYLVRPDRHADSRGFFARTYCEREFGAMDLCTRWVQCNTSHNALRGTLRGMHLQAQPHGEEKLVRCVRGAIHDVIVDLRADSPTYLRNAAALLSPENGDQLYIPRGVAHGFLTLADDTEVAYQMGNYYEAGAARGYRYDDPAFGIAWPEAVRVISDRDRDYAAYEAQSP